METAELVVDGENFNDFHEALAPPRITRVLEQMFTMLRDSDNYGYAEQQLLAQVLKVVSVWKTRKVYPEAALTELKQKLTSLQESALQKKQKKESAAGQGQFAQP